MNFVSSPATRVNFVSCNLETASRIGPVFAILLPIRGGAAATALKRIPRVTSSIGGRADLPFWFQCVLKVGTSPVSRCNLHGQQAFLFQRSNCRPPRSYPASRAGNDSQAFRIGAKTKSSKRSGEHIAGAGRLREHRSTVAVGSEDLLGRDGGGRWVRIDHNFCG